MIRTAIRPGTLPAEDDVFEVELERLLLERRDELFDELTSDS